MSNLSISKIKKFLLEKRYTEVVLEIETLTTEKNRTPALHNLLGVCRVSQKGKSERDVMHALKDFETAFYKDNFGEISLDALCNHIKLCAEMGRKDSDLLKNMLTAEKMYLEAEKKFSDNERYLTHGIDLYKYLLNHEERIFILEKILKLRGIDKTFGTLYITSQMYLSKWNQKKFGEFQKKFGDLFVTLNTKKLPKIDIDNKKIKIGFFSPDFKQSHSISFFLKNLIKDLKNTKFESFGLSLLKTNQHDETTEKFKDLFDNWFDLGDKTDQEIVNDIQNLNLDILIDLAGLWSSNRVSIFNTRICPLQINWLGFNNSSGLKEIDFILADVKTIQEEEKDYMTKIYKLPRIWNSHCGFDLKRTYNELPFKKNNYFTLGSFNNFMKINDEVLNTWVKILKKIKNSKIILKSSLYLCEDVIKKKFEQEGLIDSVKILKKTKRTDFQSHINLYDKIDLCLDTFPFNGVTTTFEALWKNVPVITKAGYNFNSRCGESILENADLSDLIAKSNEDYVNKVIFFSNNIEELEKIRKNLHEKILDTPLFKTDQFTNDFCDAMEAMYSKKRDDQKSLSL